MTNDRAIDFNKPAADEINEFKKGKNFFLGIGITDYKDTTNFPKLHNAAKDVTDIKNLLIDKYDYQEAHIELILNSDATGKKIVNTLNSYRNKLDKHDTLLIYFAGHGHLAPSSGLGYWNPYNSEQDDIFSYISNDQTLAIIKSLTGIRHILLISDSCFSGDLVNVGTDRKIPGVFKDWIANPSRFVFSSGDGTVKDGEAGKNSPFATEIINYLNTTENEATNILELADKVIKNVSVNFPHLNQVAKCYPLKREAGHKDGQFIFLRKQLTDSDIWERAVEKNTIEAFEHYLKTYPRGEFRTEARVKINDLKEHNMWKKTVDDAAGLFENYLERYPDGKYVALAKQKIALIEHTDLFNLKQNPLSPPEILKPTSKPTFEFEPEMKFVESGKFKMGGNDYDAEKPIHLVHLEGFWIAKYPITVAQFAAFEKEKHYITTAEEVGSSYIYDGGYKEKKGVYWRHDVAGNIRPETDYNHPVIHVSWFDAKAYCEWLLEITKKKFDLPSEAQWEFAARGGEKSPVYLYSGSDNLKDVGWYAANSGNRTHAVGELNPNKLGIYDMSGNVWEWCNDDWHEDYKNNPPLEGSAWIDSPRGSVRVVRGGSWVYGTHYCRSAYRDCNGPAHRSYYIGFRVALPLQ